MVAAAAGGSSRSTAICPASASGGGASLATTVSIGMATCPDDARSLEFLFDSAGRALEAARREGGDRIEDAGRIDAGAVEVPPFEEGAIFRNERMVAVVPHTSKALVSILCGIEPRPGFGIPEVRPGGLPGRCLPSLLRERGYQTVMYWGGLRGAVAVALALSLPPTLDYWYTVQSIAYGVVLFTLFVQAPTMPLLLRRLLPGEER